MQGPPPDAGMISSKCHKGVIWGRQIENPGYSVRHLDKEQKHGTWDTEFQLWQAFLSFQESRCMSSFWVCRYGMEA